MIRKRNADDYDPHICDGGCAGHFGSRRGGVVNRTRTSATGIKGRAPIRMEQGFARALCVTPLLSEVPRGSFRRVRSTVHAIMTVTWPCSSLGLAEQGTASPLSFLFPFLFFLFSLFFFFTYHFSFFTFHFFFFHFSFIFHFLLRSLVEGIIHRIS